MAVRTTTIRSSSVLIVHGRGFKPPARDLREISIAALRAGIARDYPDQLGGFDNIKVALAYYGDLSNAILSGRGCQYDETLDIDDRRAALEALRAISSRKGFGIRQYDCIPGKSAVPEFIANFVSPACGALRLTKALLSWLSPDFAEYLYADSAYAEQVRERVRSALCNLLDRGDRVMLLAHGTGSVVAYDVLWQLSHESQYAGKYADAVVDTWVTLGSPLGDDAIRGRLLGHASEQKSFPKNVVHWNNLSAEDDYTCHDNTLADDFEKMLQQRVISRVQDYCVYNLAARYGKSNPHSSVGYFVHPRLSKIIVDWADILTVKTDLIYTL